MYVVLNNVFQVLILKVVSEMEGSISWQWCILCQKQTEEGLVCPLGNPVGSTVLEAILGNDIVLHVQGMIACKDDYMTCARRHDFSAWILCLEVQRLDEVLCQLLGTDLQDG